MISEVAYNSYDPNGLKDPKDLMALKAPITAQH